MSQAELILKCKECESDKGFVVPCRFCYKPVCIKHAHFLPSGEHTSKGYVAKVVRVCGDCKPSRVI